MALNVKVAGGLTQGHENEKASPASYLLCVVSVRERASPLSFALITLWGKEEEMAPMGSLKQESCLFTSPDTALRK